VGRGLYTIVSTWTILCSILPVFNDHLMLSSFDECLVTIYFFELLSETEVYMRFGIGYFDLARMKHPAKV